MAHGCSPHIDLFGLLSKAEKNRQLSSHPVEQDNTQKKIERL